ncbi:MAG: sulfur carrier protein ThiS [Candidatus Eiseniibacteriota bacterium]
MELTLNGEQRELPDGLSALELLEHLGLRRDTVVVERNESIIPRDELEQIELASGDVIEIIQMIAGG